MLYEKLFSDSNMTWFILLCNLQLLIHMNTNFMMRFIYDHKRKWKFNDEVRVIDSIVNNLSFIWTCTEPGAEFSWIIGHIVDFL